MGCNLAPKRIGLIAHDACKRDMTEWARFNAGKLAPHKLYCTGTTGKLVRDVLIEECGEEGLDITIFKSGPLGGDQQMGAVIASEQLDILIFFTDPMSMQPHDVDIKALIRISTIANIVVACTRSTADYVISSSMFDGDYRPARKTYESYTARKVRLSGRR
ncbi:MAG: methylglyoxal synthase [Planctomycetota bacterium]|nr:methylglyoxal synthase [Planctomycetota bacterium]